MSIVHGPGSLCVVDLSVRLLAHMLLSSSYVFRLREFDFLLIYERLEDAEVCFGVLERLLRPQQLEVCVVSQILRLGADQLVQRNTTALRADARQLALDGRPVLLGNVARTLHRVGGGVREKKRSTADEDASASVCGWFCASVERRCSVCAVMRRALGCALAAGGGREKEGEARREARGAAASVARLSPCNQQTSHCQHTRQEQASTHCVGQLRASQRFGSASLGSLSSSPRHSGRVRHTSPTVVGAALHRRHAARVGPGVGAGRQCQQ